MRGVAASGCRKQEKAARTQTRAAATAADNKAPRQMQEATKRTDWPETPERKEGGLSYGVHKDSMILLLSGQMAKELRM